MQSNFQVPFIVTFMFVIFPIASFCAMLCYYKRAMKNEDKNRASEGRNKS